MQKNNPMLRPEDLARRWNVDVKTVYAAIRLRQLPSVRLGKRVLLISRRAVEDIEQTAGVVAQKAQPTTIASLNPSEVMNTREASALLGISNGHLCKVAARGEIPCRKLGRSLVFSRTAIVNWLGFVDSEKAENIASESISELARQVRIAARRRGVALKDEIKDEFDAVSDKGREYFGSGYGIR